MSQAPLRASRLILGLSLGLAALACSTAPSRPDLIVIPCDPLEGCPPGDGFAQICSLPDGNICVNVCQGATALPEGCELDEDCDAPLTCDNDDVGDSSCECVEGPNGGGECDACVGLNTGPQGPPPNPATSCVPGESEFSCDCMTQNGEMVTGFLSPGGCEF